MGWPREQEGTGPHTEDGDRKIFHEADGPRGRPRLQLGDQVQKEMQRLNLTPELLQNQDGWRAGVVEAKKTFYGLSGHIGRVGIVSY